MQPIFQFILTLLLISLLTACGPQPDHIKTDDGSGDSSQTDTESLTPRTKGLTEEQTEKLQELIQHTQNNQGSLRQEYILEMAEWLYEQLEFKAAIDAINKLSNEHLTPQQVVRAFLLKSRVLLANGKPQDALDGFYQTQIFLSPKQQIEALEIQAQAFLANQYPYEAIRTRLRLNKLLQDQTKIADNQYTIWRILSLMSLSTLKQINAIPLDNETQGWIELAIVTKSNQNNWQQLEQVYQDWFNQHPKHEAGGAFLSSLAKSQTELITHPKHIAILLPVKGKYAVVARAIRDGFLSAYYQSNPLTRPQISLIDIDKGNQSIWQHYQTAVQKGADFIVGPLEKAAIDELSQAKEIEIPVLTFNYAEQQNTVTDNLFQFGLLPEDEASQIAELAIRQGKKHAAILVPADAWGQRLQFAFQQRFEELGGEVRSIKTYQAKKNDFSNSIKNLLNLTQSNQRYKNIRSVLGNNLKFEAYRRQDIDMVFIAGQPRAARSILPQLKFHHASDLQVYSTSHAYSGVENKNVDRDINQLIFNDIPWVLEDNSIKASVEKNWPDTNKHYTRLYALGADAYHLIPYLGRLKSRSGERFNGYTGNLYLDPLLKIHRQIIPAQFTNGVATALDAESLPMTYDSSANDSDKLQQNNVQ